MRKLPIRMPVALALAALALAVPATTAAAADPGVQVLGSDTARARRRRRDRRADVRDPPGHAVHLVVLRRPAVGRAPRLGVHRVHRHRRAGQARRVQPRERPAPAADPVPRARGRRPQQPEPRLLPPQALRVRVRARRLRLPARPQQPDAVPRLHARLGRRPRLGPHAHDPARARLRARLHVPEPGRVRQAAVPVHARPLLVPVLHVDDRRQDVVATADARARAAVLGSQRAPVREVRRRARRVDPDDVLRRPSGLVQEQPLLHALQERALLQGRRVADRHDRRPPVPALRSSTWCSATRPPRAGRGRWTSRSTPTASRRSCTPAGSGATTTSATRAGTASAGSRGSSRWRAAACSAIATAGSRSTTPTRAGSC